MSLRALPLSSSKNCCPPSVALSYPNATSPKPTRTATKFGWVRAKAEQQQKGSEEEDGEKKKKRRKSKQSLLGSITEALDFSQVRSAQDAQLLDEYGALRRKIGGTYKDFFKSYVDVDGEYVEEGWVDKTCKVCKKDTRGEPRQVDSRGRYVHVACLEKSKSTNFFSKFFS